MKTGSGSVAACDGICAQVAAGNQLFHLVVDSDSIAAQLTTMLRNEKAGRVTFIPLNQVRAQDVKYPDAGNDALPLVKKLTLEAKFKDAVHQVCMYISAACR